MRILLAIADRATRDALRDVLAQAGHDVAVARDEHATLSALGAAAGVQPAVVVIGAQTDARVSAMCRRVRARAEDDTIVIAVVCDTAHDLAHDATYRALLDDGADDLLVATGPEALAACAVARVAVAERRLAEREAHREAATTLARMRRLLGDGEATAALEHEINNPLAALLAHASLLEHGLHEPGEERELLAVIVEQAHRIGAVVKRIAALRHPAGPEFVPDEREIALGELTSPPPRVGEG